MSQDNYRHHPTEPEAPPGRKQDTGKGEKGAIVEAGIGSLLRNEREKKGIDYARIYEITRLRPSILEALENEDWDSLPSPVFVTGFIRSYARALGLDEKEVVGFYLKAFPIESRQPVPREDATKTGKNYYVFLIIILLAVGTAYFLWKENPAREKVLVSPYAKGLSNDSLMKSEDVDNSLDEAESLLLSQPNEAILEENDESEIIDEEPPDDSLDEAPLSTIEEPLPLESEPDTQPESSELILKAYIREGTWLRIFVDDQDPKEYVFRPGSQPEWRATEGFELLVGNAGGIELEFKGEKIENLGARGQVIRLKLPKNYERSNSQD